jgi:hypothetical protein
MTLGGGTNDPVSSVVTLSLVPWGGRVRDLGVRGRHLATRPSAKGVPGLNRLR